MTKKKNKAGDIIETLQSVHYLYEKRLDTALSKYELSIEQYRILQILEAAPAEGLSLKQVQALLPNQTANTTRLVDKLKTKQYVVKKSAKIDKRELRIYMTETGIRVLQDARAEIKSVGKKIKKTLKSKNIKLIILELEKLKVLFKSH